MTSLSDAEIRRYAPQMALGEIAAHGQKALSQAHAVIVGAGGLGCAAGSYLAAAGVGHIALIDHDEVAPSNLQRQFLYVEEDVGASKSSLARAALSRINPHIEATAHKARLEAANVEEIFAPATIIADCSDNLATRLLVNDACFFMRKILVSAAIGRWSGLLSTFRAFEKDEKGRPRPSYRCLVGSHPSFDDASCAEEGILGSLCGVMGAWQATEVIKEITGAGRGLVGRLLIYDALQAEIRIARLSWDPRNPLNGETPSIRDLSHHRPSER